MGLRTLAVIGQKVVLTAAQNGSITNVVLRPKTIQLRAVNHFQPGPRFKQGQAYRIGIPKRAPKHWTWLLDPPTNRHITQSPSGHGPGQQFQRSLLQPQA
jgi:hypothetical protein